MNFSPSLHSGRHKHICRIAALSKPTVFIAEMWVLVESPSSWLARSENMPRMRLDRQRGQQLVVNRPRMPEVMVQFYLSGDKLLCATASKHKTTLLQRQRQVPSLVDINSSHEKTGFEFIESKWGHDEATSDLNMLKMQLFWQIWWLAVIVSASQFPWCDICLDLHHVFLHLENKMFRQCG